jgi:hypothetical protein
MVLATGQQQWTGFDMSQSHDCHCICHKCLITLCVYMCVCVCAASYLCSFHAARPIFRSGNKAHVITLDPARKEPKLEFLASRTTVSVQPYQLALQV